MISKKSIFGVIYFLFLIFLLSPVLIHGFSNQDEIEVEPFFSVHWMAPTSGSGGPRYPSLIVKELPKIGIKVELDLVAWAAIAPRSYLNTVGPYSEGGYDIVNIGMSLGSATGHPGDSMIGVYGTNSYPPNGFNIMYWSDQRPTWNNYRAAESQILLDQINSELNLTKATELLVEWQKIYYDAMPQVIVLVQEDVRAISTGLFGFDPVLPYPTSSAETTWLTSDYTGIANSVTVGVSAKSDMFLQIIADDVYDKYATTPIHDGLVGKAPSIELALPEDTNREAWMEENFPGLEYLALYPRVAKTIGEFSDDLMNYTISLRDDVYFHDGHRVDANDVAFTFRAHLTPIIGSSAYSSLIYTFGEDANGHGNDSFVVKDLNNDSHEETITFLFNATYAPFLTDYLGTAIYPEHILGSTTPGELQNNWQVTPEEWFNHSMNIGDQPPIGCGSMVLYNRNAVSGKVVLKKFDGIEWNGSAWDETSNLAHYNIANLSNMPSTYTIVESSLNSALTEMKTGNINLLDPQWTISNIYEDLLSLESINVILTTETGWQALYFHPEYQGADGVYHLNKKGVRHAISHIIPREEIIYQFHNGLAKPGYTPIPLSSWGAISETELHDYKKGLHASDNSTPLASSTTAYDQYSIELALKWLQSEGYDVTPLLPPTTRRPLSFFGDIISFIIVVSILSFRSLKKRKN